jgi:hypothetical protein
MSRPKARYSLTVRNHVIAALKVDLPFGSRSYRLQINGHWLARRVALCPLFSIANPPGSTLHRWAV